MFNFTKNKRLISLNFNFIFKKNNKLNNSYFIMLNKKNKIKYPRIGIIIPKKIVHKTYIRNKFKRIIREYFRLNQYSIFNRDYVIILYNKNILKINIFSFKKHLENIWFYFKK
ncbi:ribonuclease P protein component [Enterobacteriaceae endosymbiont of Donacia cincticornis]|uniref:ribonuclease P protein component n=1 Tax=Enterobacteriaceae endosymbiont of Donacia cincticornis TaxID=2675773 RepID=UPI001449846F|nr:ribonuclease P protein component [Enterobacteriaceae endosymbiont of Donacia cincticornis]QJC36287.1 ribonuclease P protein component [Enterobacteriaceae endosymbiont of Donacia cincticornis]